MVKDCFNFILSKPTMIQNSCQKILENNCISIKSWKQSNFKSKKLNKHNKL